MFYIVFEGGGVNVFHCAGKSHWTKDPWIDRECGWKYVFFPEQNKTLSPNQDVEITIFTLSRNARTYKLCKLNFDN